MTDATDWPKEWVEAVARGLCAEATGVCPYCVSDRECRGAYWRDYIGTAHAALTALAPFLRAEREERARLRGALETISGAHVPDQPAASGGDEVAHVMRHVGFLRATARAALRAMKEGGRG